MNPGRSRMAVRVEEMRPGVETVCSQISLDWSYFS